MPDRFVQDDLCADADPRWPCLREGKSDRCEHHPERYERYKGQLYRWRSQHARGRRKKPPPSATEWRRRYVPEPIRPYLALSPARLNTSTT